MILTSENDNLWLIFREHLDSPTFFVRLLIFLAFSIALRFFAFFVFVLAVACVPNISIVPELFVPDCPFGFL